MKNRTKSDKFSLRLYKNILKKAKREDYKFLKLSEYKKWIDVLPKFIILRHDIDISPLNALKMAEVEHSLGIVSTYYVMMRSIFYHPAAPPFFEALRKIVNMGHDIGLHYDCSFFKKRSINLRKGILNEAKAMENLLGVKVKSVSQHKPATRGRLNRLRLPYINAYNDELTSKTTYISDSGFKWRNETLDEVIGRQPKIYTLIHPTTWAYSNLGVAATYKKCSRIVEDLVRNEFSDFIKATEDHLQKRIIQKIK